MTKQEFLNELGNEGVLELIAQEVIKREIVEVRWMKIHGNDDRELPSYATEGSAGMDISAWIPEGTSVAVWLANNERSSYYSVHGGIGLGSGDRVLIPTGLKIAVPEGYEAQLRPKSGNAIKMGLSFPNCTGTIDADYRGEVMVEVINLSRTPIQIEHEMMIGQVVIARVPKVRCIQVNELDETERGEGSFGHSGKYAKHGGSKFEE